MDKRFGLLRQAVKTYKVNHCDGNKNEKTLLDFIDELEQLTIPAVSGRSEQCDHDYSDGTGTGWNVCKKCGDMY